MVSAIATPPDELDGRGLPGGLQSMDDVTKARKELSNEAFRAVVHT